MKFIGLDGRTYHKSINPYKHGTKEKSRSKIQNEMGIELSKILASYTILEEFPCYGSGGLYLDFFIPSLHIAIECDGRQHSEYVPFFHRNRSGFVKSKKNDDAKEEWCEINHITLYRVTSIEDLERILNG